MGFGGPRGAASDPDDGTETNIPLAKGKPKLIAIETIDSMNEDEFLALTAAVEARSELPLAHAIVTAAQERKLTLGESENFEGSGRGRN